MKECWYLETSGQQSYQQPDLGLESEAVKETVRAWAPGAGGNFRGAGSGGLQPGLVSGSLASL